MVGRSDGEAQDRYGALQDLIHPVVGRSLLEQLDTAGFDVTARAVRGRRLGLTSMEERAAELGGVLEIASVEGEGTRVRLEVAA